MRPARSLRSALALAALVGLAWAPAAVEVAPPSGDWIESGSPFAPMVAEVSSPVSAGLTGVAPDGGPSPRTSARPAPSASLTGPVLAGVSGPVPATERLAPALGRDDHPSRAPPRSR